MKALVKAKKEKGLWMEDIPEPTPGPNDVLIRIQKTAICGTDIHIWNWDEWAQRTIPVPMAVGHEFAGIVEDVGNNVHDFKKGDLVSGEGHLVCGTCRNCLAGRRHLCPNTSGVGVNVSGAFAEYLSIPQSNVWYADQNIDTDVLACFDPLGNAVHSALSFPVLGEDVLITGAGPIGCMAVAVCKHAGARNVVITDVNPTRLSHARKMGADLAIDVRSEKIEDAMETLNMKEGFDVGLEMSGNPSAFNSMLENMAHGGKVAILGILPKDTSINWDQVVFNSLQLKGIYGREMYETWYKMQVMIESGLDISPLITHRFPIDLFKEGFEVMASGKSGKVVLDWTAN